MADGTQFSTLQLDHKRRKVTPERAKANYLSSQLRLRLQYAKLKVEHGWQRQSLNEVENLYFRHSHMSRPASSVTAGGRRAGGSLPITLNTLFPINESKQQPMGGVHPIFTPPESSASGSHGVLFHTNVLLSENNIGAKRLSIVGTSDTGNSHMYGEGSQKDGRERSIAPWQSSSSSAQAPSIIPTTVIPTPPSSTPSALSADMTAMQPFSSSTHTFAQQHRHTTLFGDSGTELPSPPQDPQSAPPPSPVRPLSQQQLRHLQPSPARHYPTTAMPPPLTLPAHTQATVSFQPAAPSASGLTYDAFWSSHSSLSTQSYRNPNGASSPFATGESSIAASQSQGTDTVANTALSNSTPNNNVHHEHECLA